MQQEDVVEEPVMANPEAAPPPNEMTFEDQFGPISRRLRRVTRSVRRQIARISNSPEDILLEIRWRLGDEVMALPIYEAIKTRYTPCRVHVWCSYPELLDNNPNVDSVNVSSVNPHRYILLRGAPRDVFRIEHYARRAGVPTPTVRPRLGYNDWDSPILKKLPGGAGPLVAVAAGATWPTKRWPLARWRQLCSALAKNEARIIELGRGHEPVGMGACLVDQTSIRDAASVLHACNLLICTDSGLMHLALASGAPVLALFGPTDPSILIQGEENLTVLTNERECQGCWNDSQRAVTEGVCPLNIPECMGTIAPDTVAAHAMRLLAGSR